MKEVDNVVDTLSDDIEAAYQKPKEKKSFILWNERLTLVEDRLFEVKVESFDLRSFFPNIKGQRALHKLKRLVQTKSY